MLNVQPSDIVDLPSTTVTKRRASPTFTVAYTLAAVTDMDFDLNQPRLLREAKTLLAKGDAETVCAALNEHYAAAQSWWRTQDWRGRRGQAPTPQNIRETWGKWATRTTSVSRYVEL